MEEKCVVAQIGKVFAILCPGFLPLQPVLSEEYVTQSLFKSSVISVMHPPIVIQSTYVIKPANPKKKKKKIIIIDSSCRADDS